MASRHYRADSRSPVCLPVTITSIHRSLRSMGHAYDLGQGGIACELDTPLRLREQVKVVFAPLSTCILPGEVAWVGWAEAAAVRLGIRFSEDAAEQIAELLSYLTGDKPP